MMVDVNESINASKQPVDDAAVDFTGRLLKNHSCEGNFHQKYYYPQVVLNRVLNRIQCQGSALHPEDFASEHVDTVVGIGDSSSWEHSSPTVQSLCKSTWSVGPSTDCTETTPESGFVDGTNPGQKPTSPTQSIRKRWAESSSDNNTASLHSIMETEGKLGTCPKSPCSVTSEDSVFSEDYTVANDLINDFSPSAHVNDEDDVDSSFSSPFSSTSTLEASGNEYGADVEVDLSKDKVTSNEEHGAMHLRGKHRADIHIVIPKPTSGVADEEWPLSNPDMEGHGLSAEAEDGEHEERARLVNAGSSNSFYEDREFDFLKTEPVRRTTSLKTYKTPPGTPHRKKAVRFADALGLDLESVRHILNLEDPPDVPKSAMRDLKTGIEHEQVSAGCGIKYLSALFSQPSADPAFMKRVQEGKVALENCVLCDKDMTISGTIRVSNISFHKKVVVRYTTNNWLTHTDISTSYVHNSTDVSTDRFSFSLTVPKYFAVGQRLEMAVMYDVEGNTFWDNNYGRNYAVECYARAVPICESDNTWMHFL